MNELEKKISLFKSRILETKYTINILIDTNDWEHIDHYKSILSDLEGELETIEGIG